MSEETSVNNANQKRVRKKKKSVFSFLKNAKKYGKKGQTGRGTRMPDELYHYFVGIFDAIKQGITDDEERASLVNNVLERTKGEELNVIGNQLGCRVVEILLPYSSPEDLERFIEIVNPELRSLCSDNFTSHVIETLLRVTCSRATEKLSKEESEYEPKKKKKKSKQKYSDKHIKVCYDFTIKISKYALNNLEDFVWDPYAIHILRSVLKCLSGITLLPGEKPKVNLFKETVQEDKGIPPHLTVMEYKNVPEEFKELVKEFVNRLSLWPQFKDLASENSTSALLQVLLYAVKNVDKKLTKTLVRKLLDESFAPENWVSSAIDEKKDKIDIDDDGNAVTEGKGSANGNLPPVFEKQSAVRLLEAALFVANRKMYTQIYARCFINRLGQLATVPMLNFTVQRLIDNCKIKEELEPMFSELAASVPRLLAGGNTGVLVALARACLRINTKQMHFVNILEAALNCAAPEHQKYFSVLCLRLLPSDRVELTKLDKEYFINIHGSVILQCILEFQRPAKAVKSLLELTPEELVVIFCDAKGSFVADAFCRSSCVGVKARDKMLWKLKGYYQTLALSKYGSRAFEQLYTVATPEQKAKIMSELADKSGLLNGSHYGRLLANKLGVHVFQQSQKTWENTYLKIDKENKE